MNEIVKAFRRQAQACSQLGSTIYAALLERIAGDILDGGVLAELLSGWVGDPGRSALPLRLLGGVHALVLSGEAGELQRYYPTAGGRFEEAAAWRAFQAVVRHHFVKLRQCLDQPVQTNEVGRSAVLLGGFAHIDRRAQLPFRLFEIGSSAGLNLHWDRFGYRLGRRGWGDPSAPVRLASQWSGRLPPHPQSIQVVYRAGCDPNPIDIGLPEERLRLRSFVWPDQLERMAVLDRAIQVMQDHPVEIERRQAGDWLQEKLFEAAPGSVRVVFHSVVWWYLADQERAQLEALLHAAGALATPDTPLAWLRMELGKPEFAEVRLRYWPGGRERLLARAQWHGQWAEWL